MTWLDAFAVFFVCFGFAVFSLALMFCEFRHIEQVTYNINKQIYDLFWRRLVIEVWTVTGTWFRLFSIFCHKLCFDIPLFVFIVCLCFYFTMQKPLKTIVHFSAIQCKISKHWRWQIFFIIRHLSWICPEIFFALMVCYQYFFKERFLEPFYVDFIEDCFIANFCDCAMVRIVYDLSSVNYKFLL